MSTEKERVLEETTRLRGFRYGLHDFLAEIDLEGLKELNKKVYAEYLGESLLDRKTKELLLVVACIAEKDTVEHLKVHMHAANRAGASPEELLEAIMLVGGWVGNVSRANGLEAWRATFRPDLPSIDRAVELL